MYPNTSIKNLPPTNNPNTKSILGCTQPVTHNWGRYPARPRPSGQTRRPSTTTSAWSPMFCARRVRSSSGPPRMRPGGGGFATSRDDGFSSRGHRICLLRRRRLHAAAAARRGGDGGQSISGPNFGGPLETQVFAPPLFSSSR